MNEIQYVERVTLTEIRFVRGKGVDDDPVRLVAAWYRDDGTLAAERDEWAEMQARLKEGR